VCRLGRGAKRARRRSRACCGTELCTAVHDAATGNRNTAAACRYASRQFGDTSSGRGNTAAGHSDAAAGNGSGIEFGLDASSGQHAQWFALWSVAGNRGNPKCLESLPWCVNAGYFEFG
jgi:hypothetical protein